MARTERLALAAAVAVLLGTASLVPVFETLDWFPAAFGVVAVVIGSGVLARRAGLPVALQPLAGLAALVAYVVVVFAGGTLHHLVLPGRETERVLRVLLEAAGSALQEYGPPAPVLPGLLLLVVLGVGAVAVVVEALAVTLRQPALAGLPLLVLFAVPSALMPGGLGALAFAISASGWLALLLADGRGELGNWGVPVRSARGEDTSGPGRVGRRIGGAALGAAVLVPALVPGLDARLLDDGSGGGTGGTGTRGVATYNPITRLQGQLTLPQPVPVLRYRTSDPDPDYLRMTTLGVYDGEGWRQEALSGSPRDNGVAGRALPPPVGRGSVAPARAVSAQIEVIDLDAVWLPVPATPSQVEVAGPWMWDRASETVFATSTDTENLEPFRVQSARVLPEPEALRDAPGVRPAEIAPYTTPIAATPAVVALTQQVVGGQTTDYGRALALQDFFRDPDNSFRYSEETKSGGSPDALQNFLQDRAGFCEQYASAMAAMLRIAGVPSRVAVGFTPGVRGDGNAYLVTTDEAHAWPEAWFDGIGWVRFEPTPAQNGVDVPAYGERSAAVSPGADGGPAPSAAPGPGDARPDESPLERKEREEFEARQGTATPGALPQPVAGPPVRRLLAGGGLLLLLAAPALAHAVRQHRSRRRGDALAAWQLLQDTAGDLGHGWSTAETPRAAARRLAEQRLHGDAVDALERVTAAVERARYGRGAAAAFPGADVGVVQRALRSGASRRRRVVARVLPPSTLRAVGSAVSVRWGAAAALLDRVSAALRRRLPGRRGLRAAGAVRQ